MEKQYNTYCKELFYLLVRFIQIPPPPKKKKEKNKERRKKKKINKLTKLHKRYVLLYRLFIQFQNNSTITDIIMYTFVFFSSSCQYVFITFVNILIQCSIFNGKTIYSSIMHTNLKKNTTTTLFSCPQKLKKKKTC